MNGVVAITAIIIMLYGCSEQQLLEQENQQPEPQPGQDLPAQEQANPEVIFPELDEDYLDEGLEELEALGESASQAST